MPIRKSVLDFLVLATLLLGVGPAVAADNPLIQKLPPGEQEYYDKTVRLNELEADIIKLEERFNVLVKQKSHTEQRDSMKKIVDEMAQIKRDRDKKTDEYNELTTELKYKFPDKGRAVSRRYAPMEKKSLKQLEKPSKLREDLTRIKRLVDKKYKPFIDEAKAKQEAEQAKMRVMRKEVAPSDAPPPKKRIKLER